MKKDLIIGIDPGVKTGFAEWIPLADKFLQLKTFFIHEAINRIVFLSSLYEIYIVVEDARLRKWYGSNSNAKIQGAGSVKRDCKIWQDFLNDLKEKDLIKNFKMVHPLKGSTKLDSNQFEKITGYTGQTSEHSRDAGMLVFNSSINDFKAF